ncbi:hypothetical protein [Endozoicomonas elysicola]|uniref:Uncharacterized protein n=1 Tax=Endozoicomonas elysicola TaxID=305900 RepID=A0A081K9H6_9GAMM|nr:hypothetical protein [Endozoicomonas elysicola]KEI70802.1 hypothetical protein GV64_08620 [Endozoicomonas elysicola]
MTTPVASQPASNAVVTNTQQQGHAQDNSTSKGILLGLGIAFGLSVKPFLTLGACYIAYASTNQNHQDWLYDSCSSLAVSSGRKISAVASDAVNAFYEKGCALASASSSAASSAAYAAYDKSCSLISSGGSAVYQSASRTVTGLTALAKSIEYSPLMTGNSELPTNVKPKVKTD